jgi:hypothetical protein
MRQNNLYAINKRLVLVVKGFRHQLPNIKCKLTEPTCKYTLILSK